MSKASVASDLRRVVNLLNGLSEAADLLDDLQRVDETVDAAQARGQARLNELAMLVREAEDRIAKLTEDEAGLHARIDAALEGCRVEGAQIVAAARDDAEAILNDARQGGNTIIEGARQTVAKLDGEAAAVRETIATLQAEETQLRATIAEQQANLSRVEKSFADVKKRVDKLTAGIEG